MRDNKAASIICTGTIYSSSLLLFFLFLHPHCLYSTDSNGNNINLLPSSLPPAPSPKTLSLSLLYRSCPLTPCLFPLLRLYLFLSTPRFVQPETCDSGLCRNRVQGLLCQPPVLFSHPFKCSQSTRDIRHSVRNNCHPRPSSDVEPARFVAVTPGTAFCR